MKVGCRLDSDSIIDLYKLGVSEERLNIQVKLVLSANRKSYVLHGLAPQQMTLSDLEWSFHALHAISAVAELHLPF